MLLLGGALAHASCDPANDPDRTDIANARADVAAHCDCSGFTTHGHYVRCSAQIVNARVESGQLSRPCKGLVQKDAAKSTCGKPAAITCCATRRAGETTCRIKSVEGSCSGGTACVGGYPSCGDACSLTGCVPPPPIPPLPASTPCTGACPIHTVFLILMENQAWSNVKNNPSAPYINHTVLPMASHAEQYFNPPDLHPSEPNYLWLEAGMNFGILDDNPPRTNHQGTTSHLVTLLDTAGLPWRAYQEDISGIVCPLSDVGPYAVRHNPFVFFDDVTERNDSYAASCLGHVRPYPELHTDLNNNTVARYNFVTPNVCDDMHDACDPVNDPVRQGDSWLSREVPNILASQAYANNGALFLTWDEADAGDGPIGMIVLSPRAKGGGYANSIHYTHGSVLRTIQQIFGVMPLLGDAANATDLSDLFVAFP